MQRQRRIAVRAAWCGAALLASGCHKPRLTPTTDSPATLQTTLVALNDSGIFIGKARRIVDILPAFVEAQGVRRPLAVPESMAWAMPRSLNAAGQIAGFAERGSDHTHHAVWWNGNQVRLLDDRQAQTSEAAAINIRGDIVGYAQEAGGTHHALLWHSQKADNPPQELTLLSRNHAYPTGINERGAIVGWWLDAQNQPRLFLWQNQKWIDLRSGYHVAINTQGELAGDCRMSGGEVKACLWKQGQSVFLPMPFAAEQSSALALNDHGQIVGCAAPKGSGGAPRAMLWKQGHALDLNTVCPPHSSYTLEEAVAINNAGQILCTAREDIWERSVLLTPDGSRWRIRLY